MERYRLVISGEDGAAEAKLSLDTPSIPVALLVADINMSSGTAEIWQGQRRIARMRKRRGLRHPLWELV